MKKTLFLIILFLFPLFGKAIDFNESIFFYSLPSIFIFYTVFVQKVSYKIKFKPLIISILAILLFIISNIFSKNFGNGFYFLFIFINCFLMIIFSLKNLTPDKFKQGLIISSIAFSIIFILDKLNLITLGASPLNDNFIKQQYGHSYLADLIILAFPFIISDYFQSKKNRYLNLLLLVLFSIVLILTNSRSGIVAIFVGLLFLVAKTKFQKTAKLIFIVISALILLLSLNRSYQNKFEKTVTGEREKYWTLAFTGFLKSPIFGNGPNSFPLIRRASKNIIINTNLVHNSILSFLCENGIIFTFIIFASIIYGLKKTKNINNTFFVAGIIAVTHSLLDPTWSSPGIFIISFYLIFYHCHIFLQNSKNKITTHILIILATFCFIFAIFDIISNNLFISKNYQLSLFFNPFNLDSRLGIISETDQNSEKWQKNLKFTLKHFGQNAIIYQKLTNALPYPQNEEYYYKLVTINPQETYTYYQLLIRNIGEGEDTPKLRKFLEFIDQNFEENEMLPKDAIPLSKTSYNYAIKLYDTNKDDSIRFFRLAVKLFPIAGYYQVEFANSLWHNNQQEDAINQLKNNCQKYPEAEYHCKKYLENHRDTNFETPGSLEYVNYINKSLN